MLKELMEVVKSIIVAVIAAFLIITFVFETVSVEGHSMDPTLNNRDRLIVEKVSYYFRKPKDGDIVVIKYPSDTREKFIKRVIAVPGDTVSIHDNKVYVNGKAKEENYILENYMEDFNEVKVPEIQYLLWEITEIIVGTVDSQTLVL